MDIKQLEVLENENKDHKYMIHNGYFSWSYGSPQDPLIISRDTAIKIFFDFEKRTGKDAIAEMRNHVLDFVYTDKDTQLYFKTNRNRIIGLYNPKGCVFIENLDKERVYDFDI